MSKEQYVYRPSETNLQAILVNGQSIGGLDAKYYESQGFEIYDDWEVVCKLLEQAQKDKYVKPWIKITEEQYMYALEVLPPMKWEFVSGVSFFQMREMTEGNYTSIYAKIGNSFYTATRNISTKYEDLAKEIFSQFSRKLNNLELADLPTNWENATCDTSKYIQAVFEAWETTKDIYNLFKKDGHFCQVVNNKYYIA